MKAQVLYDINNLKYTDIESPSPAEGEALVRVTRCGICGSDVPRIFVTGAHNMPLVPGHEFAGSVEKCDTRPNLQGKRVGVFPLIPCGSCPQCKERHYEMCGHYDYLGSRSNGGFAEYVTVPVWNLLPIPDEVSDDDAAMLEPMCVAVHAIRQMGLIGGPGVPVSSGTVLSGTNGPQTPSPGIIAVCGLGTIGLLVALFLRDAGYRNVFCIGNKDVQREKLLAMGYEPGQFIDIRHVDAVDALREKTGGRGVDYYFECIGRSENYEQAVSCAAPLGHIMLVGNPASDMKLGREIYWKILRNQLTLKGTWNSSFYGIETHDGAVMESASQPAQDDWGYALERLTAWSRQKTAGFLPGDLITHRYRLENMPSGLEIMRTKSEEYVKVMVEM